MRNLSLYIVLILIFLGLSKSFSLSSKGTDYIFGKQAYPFFFNKSPVSVILADQFETGFIIKTYYHKYLYIEGVATPKFKTFRTSLKHYSENAEKVGLSIFRRTERGQYEYDFTPLPPGALYVGNPTYGSWERKKDGKKVWEFHRAYKNFPQYFAWGDFRPNYKFYEKMQEHIKFKKPFTGLNEEFGSKGTISLKYFNQAHGKSRQDNDDLKTLFQRLLDAPPWRTELSFGEIIKRNYQSKELPK